VFVLFDLLKESSFVNELLLQKTLNDELLSTGSACVCRHSDKFLPVFRCAKCLLIVHKIWMQLGLSVVIIVVYLLKKTMEANTVI